MGKLLVPLFTGSARDIVQKRDATTKAGSWTYGNRGRGWLVNASAERLVWPADSRYSLGPWAWSAYVVADMPAFSPAEYHGFICQEATGDGVGTNGEWSLYANSSIWSLEYFAGGSYRTVSASLGAPEAGLQVLCLSRSASGTWRMWRDGVLTGTATESVAPDESTQPLVLGDHSNGASENLFGTYYAFGVWRGLAFNQAQVNQLTRDPFGLFRYYRSMRYKTFVPNATLSGTAVPDMTEAEVVSGGQTLVLTLAGDTWIP